MSLIRAALLALLLPAAAAAHPHVFIDAALTLRYDAQGRLAAIEERWTYDALYSLLMLSEAGEPGPRGFSAAQLARLRAADAAWDPVAGGVLAVTGPGGAIPMRAARPVGTALEGDRIVSRRLHSLAAPLEGGIPVTVRVFDPTYYVAFSLPAAVTIEGRAGCSAALQGPAPADPEDALRDALAREMGRAGPGDVAIDFGAFGPDSIRIRCAG